MSKMLVAFLFVASVAFLARGANADCLTAVGGAEKLVGKSIEEDGKKLSKEYVPFDSDAAVIKQSTLPYLHRIIHPGDMVTMEYFQDRISLDVDASNKVIRASCN